MLIAGFLFLVLMVSLADFVKGAIISIGDYKGIVRRRGWLWEHLGELKGSALLRRPDLLGLTLKTTPTVLMLLKVSFEIVFYI